MMDENIFNADMKLAVKEYIPAISMLVISSLVGVYFSMNRKQSTLLEFLFGNKRMGVFPIAASLIASNITATVFQTVPSDIYNHGISYWLSSFAMIGATLMGYYIYMPIFYNLNIYTPDEYLGHRFDIRVQVLSSFLFVSSVFVTIPMNLHYSSELISLATGINKYIIICVLGTLCTFYSTVGGLKAVAWSGSLQLLAILGALSTIFYFELDGMNEVVTKAAKGGRLNFNYKFSLMERDALVPMTMGFAASWLNNVGVGQSFIMKSLALPTWEHVKQSFILFTIGMFAIFSCICFMGLIIYARYSDCDPVEESHHLILYYFIDIGFEKPAFLGIILLCIVSLVLSAFSASLSSVTGAFYSEFVSPFLPKDITDVALYRVLQIVSIISGMVCIVITFLVDRFDLIPFFVGYNNFTTGPMIGLYTLGLLFPSANTTGVLSGGCISLAIMGWIVFMAQSYSFEIPKPAVIEQCSFLNYSSTIFPSEVEPLSIYRLSMFLYVLIGVLIVLLIGLLVSWITGGNDKVVDKKFISPMIHWVLPNPKEPKYCSIENVISMLSEVKSQ